MGVFLFVILFVLLFICLVVFLVRFIVGVVLFFSESFNLVRAPNSCVQFHAPHSLF